MTERGFLDAAARQAEVARQRGARPWPVPERAWAQAETREQMVLIHWPIATGRLARFLPPELSLETFDGSGWLGAVGFRVRDHRLRGLPPLPGLAGGVQLELRTYVTDGTHSGIWLLALESSSRGLTETSKRSHLLPARRSAVSLEPDAGGILLEAARDGLAFSARVEAAPGAGAPPPAGSFAAFCCERFVLYTADGGRLYRAELQCSPWSVRDAQVAVGSSTLVPVPLERAPRALIGARQDVVTWSLEEVDAAAGSAGGV